VPGNAQYSFTTKAITMLVAGMFLFSVCNHLSNSSIENRRQRSELMDSSRQLYRAMTALQTKGELPVDLKFADSPSGRQDKALILFAAAETKRMKVIATRMVELNGDLKASTANDSTSLSPLIAKIVSSRKLVERTWEESDEDAARTLAEIARHGKQIEGDAMSELVRQPNLRADVTRVFELYVFVLRDMQQLLEAALAYAEGKVDYSEVQRLEIKLDAEGKELEAVIAKADEQWKSLAKRAEQLGIAPRSTKPR